MAAGEGRDRAELETMISIAEAACPRTRAWSAAYVAQVSSLVRELELLAAGYRRLAAALEARVRPLRPRLELGEARRAA